MPAQWRDVYGRVRFRAWARRWCGGAIRCVWPRAWVLVPLQVPQISFATWGLRWRDFYYFRPSDSSAAVAVCFVLLTFSLLASFRKFLCGVMGWPYCGALPPLLIGQLWCLLFFSVSLLTSPSIFLYKLTFGAGLWCKGFRGVEFGF